MDFLKSPGFYLVVAGALWLFWNTSGLGAAWEKSKEKSKVSSDSSKSAAPAIAESTLVHEKIHELQEMLPVDHPGQEMLKELGKSVYSVPLKEERAHVTI